MCVLSKNLQYLMEVKSINKNQLAKVIFVGSSAVGKWVNGEITDLKLPSLISLSNFFNVSIDNLVFCNLEAQDKLKSMYTDYEYIKFYGWKDIIETENANTVKIPKALLRLDVNKHNIFAVEYSKDYYGIFPKNSILVFEKTSNLQQHDVLLVRNKIINNLLFISFNNEEYKSVLTTELVDIEQYVIEGVLINIILAEVFLNL